MSLFCLCTRVEQWGEPKRCSNAGATLGEATGMTTECGVERTLSASREKVGAGALQTLSLTRIQSCAQLFPHGPVARISRSHRGCPGSIPGVGSCFCTPPAPHAPHAPLTALRALQLCRVALVRGCPRWWSGHDPPCGQVPRVIFFGSIARQAA